MDIWRVELSGFLGTLAMVSHYIIWIICQPENLAAFHEIIFIMLHTQVNGVVLTANS